MLFSCPETSFAPSQPKRPQQAPRRIVRAIAFGLVMLYTAPVLAQTAIPSSASANASANVQPAAPMPPEGRPLPPNYESDYVLGAGDAVQIDIFNVPNLSGENARYSVLVDGSLNLPWIGKVNVRGLTLQEASDAIASRYAEFIREPIVTVTLLTPRPMRVAIVGEVNRPGAYTTGQSVGTGPAGQTTLETRGEARAGELRTVIEAIQTAGGITQLADVRNVEVRRPRLNGTEEVILVDLWAFLQSGNLQQNVTLRDGDTVIVPTATALNPDESQRLAAASFSPDTISVNVVGEVVRPGTVSVSPNTSLNQAILAAGGFDDVRASKGRVTLIRLNPDGTVARREIPVDLSANLNDETNPILRSNDIVVVSPSGRARTTDVLGVIGGAVGAVLNPIGALFNIFRTVDDINRD